MLRVRDINVVLVGRHLKLVMCSSMGVSDIIECYFKANFLQAGVLNIRTNPKQLFKCLSISTSLGQRTKATSGPSFLYSACRASHERRFVKQTIFKSLTLGNSFFKKKIKNSSTNFRGSFSECRLQDVILQQCF